MADVERGNAVAELAENVPGTRRVGAAGNEHGHLSARRDQLEPADVVLHKREQVRSLHNEIVQREALVREADQWRGKLARSDREVPPANHGRKSEGAPSQPRFASPGSAFSSTSCAKFASPYAWKMWSPASRCFARCSIALPYAVNIAPSSWRVWASDGSVGVVAPTIFAARADSAATSAGVASPSRYCWPQRSTASTFVLAPSMNARSVTEQVCETGPPDFARLDVTYVRARAEARSKPSPQRRLLRIAAI